jgi:hypothetical protein
LPRLIFSPRAAADLEAIGDHIQVALSPLCFWQFSARLNFELEFLAGMCYFVNTKGSYYSNNSSSESGAECRRKSSLQPPSGAPIGSLLPEPRLGRLSI